MRFGGVIALCRPDANGLAVDPAGLDVSRLPGSAVVFGERTGDGRVGVVLGVVDRALVVPMGSVVPGQALSASLTDGSSPTADDAVVYVEWETGGGKLAVDFEGAHYQQNNWGVFSMGCEGSIFEIDGRTATKVAIRQAVVQPKEAAADPLQTLWRIPG